MSDQERCAPGCGKTTAEMGPGEFWGGYFHVDADLPTRAGLMPLFCTAACLDRAKASQPEKPRREPVAPWVRFVDGVAPGGFEPVDTTWELPPGIPVPPTQLRQCKPRCGMSYVEDVLVLDGYLLDYINRKSYCDQVCYSKAKERAAPTCVGSLCTHGAPVLRVRGSLLGGSARIYMCDACYLSAEKLLASDAAADDDDRRPGLSAWMPPARVGTVPQSLGPGAGIGIWASRGMRSK